jgi:hypothetical protein
MAELGELMANPSFDAESCSVLPWGYLWLCEFLCSTNRLLRWARINPDSQMYNPCELNRKSRSEANPLA